MNRCWLTALALATAVAVALPFAPRDAARAHPLGNFTINRYARIDLYRDRLRLTYVLDYAEIPAFQLKNEIDSDHDGRLAPAELAAHAARLQATVTRDFDLTVDGAKVTPVPLAHTGDALPGQGGLDTLRFTLTYDAPVAAHARLSVAFVDRNLADRAGWKEIVVRPSAGAEATVAPALLSDRSAALTAYPAEDLRSAPDVREAAFSWVAGTGTDAPAAAAAGAPASARTKGNLDRLLDHEGSLLTFLLLFLAAFVFGAQHALGPGHGKTVVAAYLVGSRGTIRHALALGFTVTATHTSTVYILGFVTLAAAQVVSPERLYLYLGVASGLAILGMGVVLFAARLRSARSRGGAAGVHRHGPFGKPHRHGDEGPGEARTHGHERERADAHDHGHEHGQPDATAAESACASWRNVLTLGVIGGLLPCPSAIVVMLAAISRGQVLFGMLLIVAFSLGLAVVLTGIGMALVLGRGLTARRPGLASSRLLARAIATMPVLSAGVIAVAGVVITYQALQKPGL